MKCAVVIPVYKPNFTTDERISLYWTLNNLKGYDIFIVCPYDLESQLERRFKGLNVYFKCFPSFFFESISGYNKLLKAKQFYCSFSEYEYILIAQLDCLVLSSELDYWCDWGYSYVGAPWFEGGTNPLPDAALAGVGNGGFSLRRIESHLEALSSFRYLPYQAPRANASNLILKIARFLKHEIVLSYNFSPLLSSCNEDIFWGTIASGSIASFAIPSPFAALRFSFEVNPRKMYELSGRNLPFGCHAWNRYDKAFWLEVLPSEFFDAADGQSFLLD